jgi:hypothetical protein
MKSSDVIHADAPPDILSRLHTLRAYADHVKNQADDMGLLTVATHCAAIREAASAAIDHHNQAHTANHVKTSRVG